MLAALGTWLLLSRAPRTWKFALLWIPVAILPVAFLTVRSTPRYLYLPSMGLAALAGMAWARAWEHAARRRLLVAALVAVLVLQVGVMEVVLSKRGALARAELERREDPSLRGQKNSPEAVAPGESLDAAENAR
jgi:hypothetical protein